MAGYPGLPFPPPAEDKFSLAAWFRQITQTMNQIMLGKQNVVLSVTLNASAATTVVQDPRISGSSAFYFNPTNAAAQTELKNGGQPYPSAQESGTVTFNHLNNATADKTFQVLIIG